MTQLAASRLCTASAADTRVLLDRRTVSESPLWRTPTGFSKHSQMTKEHMRTLVSV